MREKSHIFIPETLCDAKICQKCICGRGFPPDLAEEADDAPTDLLVGWGGNTLSPHPTPLGSSNLTRLQFASVVESKKSLNYSLL